MLIELVNQLSLLIRGGKLEDDIGKSAKTTERDNLRGRGLYGVVIGPSGTGKTLLTRQVCKQDPVGVLYHKIYNPGKAAKELAKAAGLIVSPKSLVDLLLGYVSERYCPYHTLPEDASQGIAYVLDTVAEQAIMFKKKHGYVPSFVIDGVDLLASSLA